MSCFDCRYLPMKWKKPFDNHQEPCASCMREDGFTSEKPPKPILYDPPYRPYWQKHTNKSLNPTKERKRVSSNIIEQGLLTYP